MKSVGAAIALIAFAATSHFSEGQEKSATTPAASTAGQPTGPVAPPKVARGDQWSYDYTDESTGDPSATMTYTVTELTDKDTTVKVSKLGGPMIGAIFVFDANWNLKQDNVWKNFPDDGLGFSLPLSVGKEWSSSGSNKNTLNGGVFKHQGKSKVVEQAKVTTPAGSFETFKIVSDMKWVPANGAGSKSEIHAETWFAPDINRIVKRTYVAKYSGHVFSQYTMELTDNSPTSN